MTVWCYGSINIDHVYSVDHLPAPGETLAVAGYAAGLGGKGANQSVAAARAGADMRHLGAVGPDGLRALAQMQDWGVDCAGVQRLDSPTGHAIIMVDRAGENAILVHPGANRALALDPVLVALREAELGDILLMQNETAHAPEVARAAVAQGMEVIYSAAPFDLEAVRAVMTHVSTIVMNAVEAAQLQAELGLGVEDLPVEAVVVTRGAEGASWHARGTPEIHVPTLPTDVVDTTGAGDCFTGALAAALADGQEPAEAMRFAAAAASLQVSRAGAAPAMPARAEIMAKLAEAQG